MRLLVADVAHILLDSINHLGKQKGEALGCPYEYIISCGAFVSVVKLFLAAFFLLTCRALAPLRLTLTSSVAPAVGWLRRHLY